jgi:hypothetical protein
VPYPWGVAIAINEVVLLEFRGHLSRLGLYPYSWGAAAVISEAAPLKFRGHLSRFMTISVSNCDVWPLQVFFLD